MSRVVVLGSLNMDLVVSLSRLPRSGETVIGDRLQRFPGGKGANQAVAAARLGAEVAMVGRVGKDSFGEELLSSLRTDGVAVDGVERDANEPTGAALILVEKGGENMIAVARGAGGVVGDADVARATTKLRELDVLLLQLEIPLAAVASAARRAKAAGAWVILNAAPAAALEASLLRQVDVLVVNELEAEPILGRPAADSQEAEEAARIAVERGARSAVVTLGAAGAVLADGNAIHRMKALRVDAVDATGAGDAFVGALAAALAAGAALVEAAELAGAAGAAAVTKPGAQASLPRPEDLQRLFGMAWPVHTRPGNSSD
jgi:ribokinase